MADLSTITMDFHYGVWYPNDVPTVMDEIEKYIAHKAYWELRTKDNVNESYDTFETLRAKMEEYEKLLQASIRQLESWGWSFEPSEPQLDHVWKDFQWL